MTEAPTLDDALAGQVIVGVFEQIVAVLARASDAVIEDVELFELADALFAAFARAGEDGLTTEQIRAAGAAHPDEVVTSRINVLRRLGGIRPAFDKPHQRQYRASFTSYVSLLFFQRMLTRGGQSELHQLLTAEQVSLERDEATPDEARDVTVRITTALRLLVAELVALTVGGTIEALRERAPLMWNAKSLIDRASTVHTVVLHRWPELARWCAELRSAIAAYEDASTAAATRLTSAAGTSRALDLLPPEMWLRFARRAGVDELAEVLSDQVFDAPAPWLDVADLCEAVAEVPKPASIRTPPPRSHLPDDADAGPERPDRQDPEAVRLAAVASELLCGRDQIAVADVLSGEDWAVGRRLLADLAAASNHDQLPYQLRWGDQVTVSPDAVPSWLTSGVFQRTPGDT
ncbi:MAG: hypothetical protein HKP61_03550 [Dactylosporangium sp.]|nr:hypothetical protein [Dactylosporangium sp.]NNJ60029.1 hypothetical protein [Dactylosporangium sp.]